MKHVCYFLLLTVLISCNKVDDLLTFNISDEATFTVESTALVNVPIPVPTPEVATNSSREFENNDTRADLVKDVRLNDLKLSIVSPSGKTFSFLKSIQVFISTNQNDEIVLASLDNVPSSASVIDLETTSEKLDTYVKASSYKLRTSIVTRETLTEDVEIRMKLNFTVTADPL